MERIITKSFARLMGRGTHRGFITIDELNKSLGKRNLNIENLEQAFIHILDEKILLVEKKSDFKTTKKKKLPAVKILELPTKAMIQLECILEKWEVLSYSQEKEKSQLPNVLRQAKM